MPALKALVVWCLLAALLLSPVAALRRLSEAPSDGNLSGALQGCTDVAPGDGLTCAQHKEAGDCNTSKTTSRNFCAATCGRCSGPVAAETAAPAAAAPASASPAAPTAESTSPAPSAELAAPTHKGAVAPAPALEAASLVDTPAPAPEAARPSAVIAPSPTPEPAATAAVAPAEEAAAGPEAEAPGASAPANATTPAATASANGTMVVPGSGEVYEGDGTAYSEAVDNTGKGFACSFRYLNDWASTHFAAVNIHQWDEGYSCGRCATVRCVDPRCQTQNKDVTVLIVDQCPECDLDFSVPVYREITGMWPHRLRVQWQWADCSSHINGTIRMYPKDGINAFWQAFYFANAKYPLANVTLNGITLTRSQFGFYQHPAPLGDGPHEFEFTASNGMRVKAFSENPLQEQDLKVQFGRPGTD